MLERAAGEFSVTDGPYLAVLRRLHLTRGDRTPRASVLVAIAWLPLFAAALVHVIAGRPLPELLRDLSVHVRLLVGIPLMVHAGRLLRDRCLDAVAQMYGIAEPAQLDPIIGRAMRLRRSRAVELAIAAIVVVGGQLEVWRMGGRSGIFSGVTELGGASFARVWYAAVALPLTKFLLYDWLWQWALWSYVVIHVSRLPLTTVATHPDRAAGVGFLDEPLSAFAVFVLAGSAMMAAAWDTQVLEQGVSPQEFVIQLVVVAALVTVIAVGPLFAYVGPLYRTRQRDRYHYDELALAYVHDFDRKWIGEHGRGERLLATPDIRSLRGIIQIGEHVDGTRLVPCSPRALVGVWAGVILPMVPLAVLSMPIGELVKKVAEGMLAGLPI
jgi:hypothetical protein